MNIWLCGFVNSAALDKGSNLKNFNLRKGDYFGTSKADDERLVRTLEYIEKLLESIGDEYIDFTPWEGAMTLGELALHVAGANDAFVSMVETEKLVLLELPEC